MDIEQSLSGRSVSTKRATKKIGKKENEKKREEKIMKQDVAG